MSFGVISSILGWATIFTACMRLHNLNRKWCIAVWTGLAALLCVPIQGLYLAGYLRGVLGDFSLGSIAFMFLYWARIALGRSVFSEREQRVGCVLILMTMAAFYPASLGLTHSDPYRFGYQPTYLLAVLALATLAAWLANLLLPVFLVTVSLVGYSLGCLESSNLWDYLFDPMLGLFALGVAAGYARPGSRMSQ